MLRILFLFLSLSMAFSIEALGESSSIGSNAAKTSKVKKCLFPKSKQRAPAWLCNVDEDNLAVTSVGSFAKSKAGVAFMEQMAAADARAHLADKLHLSVEQKIVESGGVGQSDKVLISKISNEQLQGTKVLKSIYGPRGTLYVLMGFDEAGAKKLQEAITLDYLAQKRK